MFQMQRLGQDMLDLKLNVFKTKRQTMLINTLQLQTLEYLQ